MKRNEGTGEIAFFLKKYKYMFMAIGATSVALAVLESLSLASIVPVLNCVFGL